MWVHTLCCFSADTSQPLAGRICETRTGAFLQEAGATFVGEIPYGGVSFQFNKQKAIGL